MIDFFLEKIGLKLDKTNWMLDCIVIKSCITLVQGFASPEIIMNSATLLHTVQVNQESHVDEKKLESNWASEPKTELSGENPVVETGFLHCHA